MINEHKNLLIIIGNDVYHKYSEFIDKYNLNNILVVDIYKYNIKYTDNDNLFNCMNKLHSIFENKSNNIINLFDDKQIDDRINMIMEDKDFVNYIHCEDNCV